MTDARDGTVGAPPGDTTGSVDRLVDRMLAMGAGEPDATVAYLCAWVAVDRLVMLLSRRAGVRPQFSLRRNGTLRTHIEGGYKLPELMPAREDHRWRAALDALSMVDRRSVLEDPHLRALATRRPVLEGRPLLRDAYGQRPMGVIDVAMTRDARYPVWHTVDLAAVTEALSDSRSLDAMGESVWQAAVLLRTVHSNLLAADGAMDREEARLGLPLLRLLAGGLIRALHSVPVTISED